MSFRQTTTSYTTTGPHLGHHPHHVGTHGVTSNVSSAGGHVGDAVAHVGHAVGNVGHAASNAVTSVANKAAGHGHGHVRSKFLKENFVINFLFSNTYISKKKIKI